MLIKMIDGGLINVLGADKNSRDCFCSQEFCNVCKSQYVITMSSYKLTLFAEGLLGQPVNEVFLLKMFLKHFNKVSLMTESEFINWFKEELTILTKNEFNFLLITESNIKELK